MQGHVRRRDVIRIDHLSLFEISHPLSRHGCIDDAIVYAMRNVYALRTVFTRQRLCKCAGRKSVRA